MRRGTAGDSSASGTSCGILYSVRLGFDDALQLYGYWWRHGPLPNLGPLEVTADGTRTMGLARGFAETSHAAGNRSGETAEDPCHGTLTFEPEIGLRLRLHNPSAAAFPELDDDRFVVHGVDEHGVPCTLLDCLVGPVKRQMFRDFSSVEVRAGSLLRGVLVEDETDLEIRTATLEIAGLVDVLTEPWQSDGEARAGLDGAHTARVPGAELVFLTDSESSVARHATIVRRTALVEVRFGDPVGLREWRDRWESPLVDFVAFATRGVRRIERLTVLHEEADGQRGEIDLLFRQSDLRASREPKAERLLLTYAALGDDLEPVVAHWFELHRDLGRAAAFLFGAVTSRMVLENKLINLMSAAEAFHRTRHDERPVGREEHERLVADMLAQVEDEALRTHYARRLEHADEPAQRKRIRWLIDRAAEVLPELGRRRGPRARQLNATRNAFVHLPTDAGEVLADHDLARAVDALILVLEANLLLELGLGARAEALLRRAYQQDLLLRDLATEAGQ